MFLVLLEEHEVGALLLSQNHCFCLNGREQVLLTQRRGDQNELPTFISHVFSLSAAHVRPDKHM